MRFFRRRSFLSPRASEQSRTSGARHRRPPTEAALFRWLQSQRADPFVQMRSGFGLTCSLEHCIAFRTGWEFRGLFADLVSRRRQSVLEGCCLPETPAPRHGAAPCFDLWARAQPAFSSPIDAQSRAVMTRIIKEVVLGHHNICCCPASLRDAATALRRPNHPRCVRRIGIDRGRSPCLCGGPSS